MCKCSLCGESLTAPVIIEGKIFGWSCAKKVYPGMSKPKAKYVVADSFVTEDFENGNTGILAVYSGKKYRDCIITKKYNNGQVKRVSNGGVQLVDNVAYINIAMYLKK